jgi:hypothetical protein
MSAPCNQKNIRQAFDEATPVFVVARDQALQTLGEAARHNRVNLPTAWVMKRHARVLETLDAAQSVKSLLRMREKAWQTAKIMANGDSLGKSANTR